MAAPQAPAKEGIESVFKVEPLALEVGLGLVKLVEGGENSPLLRRIAAIRKQMAADAGILVPPVRVTDNLQLQAGEYVVLLKGAEIARYKLAQNCELAIHPGARSKGCAVVDAVSVLGTHLAELIRRHAHELLSRQDTKNILDRVADENPKAIEDLVPKLLPLAAVQRVLQNLLRALYGLASQRPAQILSVDVYRIAAADQLRSLAAILGVGCEIVETPAALAQAIDLERTVDRYEMFAPHKLIFTRLDETESFGGSIDESVRRSLPISFLSAGQAIPDDLEPASRERLAARVLGGRLRGRRAAA